MRWSYLHIINSQISHDWSECKDQFLSLLSYKRVYLPTTLIYFVVWCTMSLSMAIEYLWTTACMFYNRVLSIEYFMVAKLTVLSWSWTCIALVCWYLMQIYNYENVAPYTCRRWDFSYCLKICCGDFKFNDQVSAGWFEKWLGLFLPV